jgi:4-hydroxybenzoate polyprenyltransferase
VFLRTIIPALDSRQRQAAEPSMIGLRERIARPFRYARPGNWWFSKIPPLLAVAYLAVLNQDIDFGRAILLLGCFVFSVSCVAAYGHAINDTFDVEQDRQAGKANAMAALGWSGRFVLIGAFLCAGFLPALLAGYPASAVLLLALNYVGPAAYSLPGIRLKERGISGVICDAVSSHVTPTLFVLFVFGAPQTGQFAFSVAVTLWAAALGIKGILHHQILDRENDIRSGTATFSTTLAPESSRWFLIRFNLAVELPVSTLLVVVVYRWCPLGAAALAIYCAFEALKFALGFRFRHSNDSQSNRASIPFANEQFYVFWLPLAAAVQLATGGPEWLLLPVLHMSFFYQPTLLQMHEAMSVVRIAARACRRLLLGPRK